MKNLLPKMHALAGYFFNRSAHQSLNTPQCSIEAPKDVIYTITDIYPEHVVIDGNHPLSGLALRISVKVTGVRHATSEEKKHGTCGFGFFSLPPSAGNDFLH